MKLIKTLRAVWKKIGYYVSAIAIVLLVGASAYMIRNRPPTVPEARPMASGAPSEEAAHEQTQPAAAPLVATYCLPVEGAVVLNAYSAAEPVWSKTMFEWHVHRGIDLVASAGEPVVAVADGKVVAVEKSALFGHMVEIEHDGGLKTRYASLLTRGHVDVGDLVEKGQAIGAVGSSAPSESAEEPHLHFEAEKDGEWAAILEPILAGIAQE